MAVITISLRDGRNLLVRAATQRDAVAMIGNLNEVAAEGIYLGSEQASWSEEGLQRIIGSSQPHSIILVAELDGHVVGDLWLMRGRLKKTYHTAAIGMLVRSEVRGLGIAKALIGAAVQWAEKAGVEKLTLSVFSSNKTAIELYKAYGFREEGVRPRQYRLPTGDVDEVMMARFL